MNIEIGKKYRTRGGWMAFVKAKNGAMYAAEHFGIGTTVHDSGGKAKIHGANSAFDLISPWEEPAAPVDQDTAAIRRQYACAALTGLLARKAYSPGECKRKALKIADAMMEAENALRKP